MTKSIAQDLDIRALNSLFSLSSSVVRFIVIGLILFTINPTIYTQSERINKFECDIIIDTSGEIIVKETILVTAAGDQIKRGIFRTLPTKRKFTGQTKRFRYDFTQVLHNGIEAKYHTENSGDNLLLYIGEEDVFIESGTHTYVITYNAGNQIGYFDKYDELYWNVTGNAWSFPIDTVVASIELPSQSTFLQNACYTGSVGSQASNCQSVSIAPNIIQWIAYSLAPEEGLTVAAGFRKGIVKPIAPPGWIAKNGILSLVLAVTLGLLVYLYTRWKKYGIDPPSPTVYPQFNIPKNLSPASIGYIWKEKVDKSYISASIIHLAVQGFLEIKEIETKHLFGLIKNTQYTLVKIKNADATLPAEEALLLKSLFASSDHFTLDGKYDPSVASLVQKYTSSIEKQIGSIVTKGNNYRFLIIPFLVILVTSILILVIDNVNFDRIAPMLLLSVFIWFGWVGGFFAARYFFNRYQFMRWIFLILFSVIIVFVFQIYQRDIDQFYHLNLYIYFLFLIIGFFAILLYQYLIRQPSPEKLHIQSLIEGFKMYLGAAEENQLQQFNPPKMTPEVFEKLLPFAIILGVDNIWGDQFNNYLKEASIEPDSYHSRWYHGSNLSSASFGSSLHSSMSSSFTSASTAPSSSGSGGGGSSGGGGGGGGGGGW